MKRLFYLELLFMLSEGRARRVLAGAARVWALAGTAQVWVLAGTTRVQVLAETARVRNHLGPGLKILFSSDPWPRSGSEMHGPDRLYVKVKIDQFIMAPVRLYILI